MSPLPVDLREDVEQEGFNVEVEGFVVEEQLGKKAKILAVQLEQHSFVQWTATFTN